MGANELKIPIGVDTARAIAEVKQLKSELNQTAGSGEQAGKTWGSTFDGLKNNIGSVVGALTGVSLGVGGVVSMLERFLTVQREVLAAQVQSALAEQQRLQNRAASLTGGEARAAQTAMGWTPGELEAKQIAAQKQFGTGAGDFQAMAADMGAKFGKGAGTEALMGDLLTAGYARGLSGQDMTTVADVLADQGVTDPDAVRSALAKFYTMNAKGFTELDSKQIAEILAECGQDMDQLGYDTLEKKLALIAGLSMTYRGRKRAISGAIKNMSTGAGDDRGFAAPGFEARQAEALGAMGGAKFSDVRAAAARIRGTNEAKLAASVAGRPDELAAPGSTLEAQRILTAQLATVGPQIPTDEAAQLGKDRSLGEDASNTLAIKLASLQRLYGIYRPMLAAQASARGFGVAAEARQSQAAALLQRYDAIYLSSTWGNFDDKRINIFHSLTVEVIQFLRSAGVSGKGASGFDSLGTDIGPSPANPAPSAPGTPVGMGGQAGGGFMAGVMYFNTPTRLATNDSTRLG